MRGRVAIVTGGSRGIGRAVCVSLAGQGVKVFINYSSSADSAKETQALCAAAISEKFGSAAELQPELLPFDVSSREAVDQAFEQVLKSTNRLDILINNAGISLDGLLVRYKDDDWRKTFAVNLDGAFYCSRAAGKTMMKARSGRIVNVSSVVGEMGNPGQAAYVSSKAGLIGLTKTLAKELASRNITVNAVTPGFIETDMTGSLDPKVKEEHLKSVPLGRTGEPQEVAELITFLCLDAAAYITGQVIGVNGGLYM